MPAVAMVTEAGGWPWASWAQRAPGMPTGCGPACGRGEGELGLPPGRVFIFSRFRS